MEIAAITCPEALRIGGAYAFVAFVDGLGPAALTHGGQLGRSELGVAKSLMQALGILPGQEDLRGGTGFHRQHGADRNRIAQTGSALHGCDAHTLIALTAVDLGGFTGAIQ